MEGISKTLEVLPRKGPEARDMAREEGGAGVRKDGTTRADGTQTTREEEEEEEDSLMCVWHLMENPRGQEEQELRVP